MSRFHCNSNVLDILLASYANKTREHFIIYVQVILPSAARERLVLPIALSLPKQGHRWLDETHCSLIHVPESIKARHAAKLSLNEEQARLSVLSLNSEVSLLGTFQVGISVRRVKEQELAPILASFHGLCGPLLPLLTQVLPGKVGDRRSSPSSALDGTLYSKHRHRQILHVRIY
jgi:hypothetical protein